MLKTKKNVLTDSPVESEKMTNVEICTTWLLEKIESGEIGPDTRLGEPSLAREIGVDRGAVRAAFERLEMSGLLKRVPRSGTYLKQVSSEELHAVNQVRCQLEILGVRLVSQVAGKTEISQLLKTGRILDELIETYANGELSVWSTIRSLEIEFHTMIARFSKNPYLLSMMNRDSFMQLCFPFISVSIRLKRGEMREYLKDAVTHVDIVRAIQKRDVNAAEALIVRHVEDDVITYDRIINTHKKDHGKKND